MKNYDVLEAHKNKIDVFNVEKSNLIEKIRFLESKHHSLLEKHNFVTEEIKNNKPSPSMNENFHRGTEVLNEILDECKTHGDKRGLRYINKDETPSSGETVFAKSKDDTPNQVESPKKASLCTHCKKTGHLNLDATLSNSNNRLMNNFNSLTNNIMNNGKGNETIKNLEVNLVPPSHHLRLKKFG